MSHGYALHSEKGKKRSLVEVEINRSGEERGWRV